RKKDYNDGKYSGGFKCIGYEVEG
ncbi:hypothetical protein L195_g021454, partial [Trifolium pratense]